MANSKAIWCITYSDFSTEFVKAHDVWQIVSSYKLEKDTDYIVSIIRIDFCYDCEDIKDLTDTSRY